MMLLMNDCKSGRQCNMVIILARWIISSSLELDDIPFKLIYCIVEAHTSLHFVLIFKQVVFKLISLEGYLVCLYLVADVYFSLLI